MVLNCPCSCWSTENWIISLGWFYQGTTCIGSEFLDIPWMSLWFLRPGTIELKIVCPRGIGLVTLMKFLLSRSMEQFFFSSANIFNSTYGINMTSTGLKLNCRIQYIARAAIEHKMRESKLNICVPPPRVFPNEIPETHYFLDVIAKHSGFFVLWGILAFGVYWRKENWTSARKTFSFPLGTATAKWFSCTRFSNDFHQGGDIRSLFPPQLNVHFHDIMVYRLELKKFRNNFKF